MGRAIKWSEDRDKSSPWASLTCVLQLPVQLLLRRACEPQPPAVLSTALGWLESCIEVPAEAHDFECKKDRVQ